ncbi:MAG: hypothetical protein B7Y41_06235 [Hydrogenophilales bacterium 28-61-23]|nr:MAG: hypothetical protein B7Y41_06235 [Hydrogenophilales bacterium 28-61-23]
MAKKPLARRRAKNLDDKAIEAIIGILDGWAEALTWERLIEAIEGRLYARYTRQALFKHERVRAAFVLRKEALSQMGTKRARQGPPELVAAVERIARLEAQVQRLDAENKQLLEQFVRWAYNAFTRGLDQDFLNRPLPQVNRGQTRQPLRAMKSARK